jgi:hypothetical protein
MHPTEGSGGTHAPPPQDPDTQPDAGHPITGAPNGDAAVGSDGSGTTKPHLVITADFLNQTLSFIDLDKLQDGAKRSDALIGTLDLSMYAPGPLALGVTPDGKTALVSVSGGFLGAFTTVPPGAGTLLFVDVETRSVKGELYVGDSPMGIVITQDGKRAFVGLYAESYFALVDIEKQTFVPVQTGASYNEELAIDDTGTVGILSYGPAGDVKTFSVDDPANTLGQTIGLTGDAAGVAFFPGTKLAYVMEAPTALTGNVGGHDVVDVSNPMAPVAMDEDRQGSYPSTYPVTAVAARNSIVYNATVDGVANVVEVQLDGQSAHEVQRVKVAPTDTLAYGIASTSDGRVLIAVPGEHYVGVVDLRAGTAFTVPWEVSMSGPTEIIAVP